MLMLRFVRGRPAAVGTFPGGSASDDVAVVLWLVCGGSLLDCEECGDVCASRDVFVCPSDVTSSCGGSFVTLR
eukprot:12927409-Prorocentrum_lima.AAC.1